MFRKNVLIISTLLGLIVICLGGCKSAPQDLEAVADQIVNEETHKAAIDDCKGKLVSCVREIFAQKTKEYCSKNKLEEAQCIILDIHVMSKDIRYTEAKSEETRSLTEKIRQSMKR